MMIPLSRLGGALLVAALAGAAPARAEQGAFSLEYSYAFAGPGLTTEQALQLDPEQPNPHRQRWALSRQLELVGLTSRPLPGGRFGVQASGVRANVRGLIRAPGPWYRPIAEFPCTAAPESWFGTESGATLGAQAAERVLQELLGRRKLKLSLMLDRISSSTPEIANVVAGYVYETWRRELESDWRSMVANEIRREEWRFYADAARKAKVCPRKTPALAVPWHEMMEPAGTAAPVLKGRAPARRWNGLYSVRLSVTAGGRVLNGQFLVDTGAATSVVSPLWLESQGVLPTLIEAADAPRLGKVTWSGPWAGGGKLARRVSVEKVELSGLTLDLKEFLLADTEFFHRPEHIGTCCDGVLGADFFRDAVVEFSPGPPAELKVWALGGFQSPGQSWAEAFTRERGEGAGTVGAACRLARAQQALKEARLETGSEHGLALPVATSSTKDWALSCGGTQTAAGLRGTAVQGVPAGQFSLGLPYLGKKPLFLDLPHGRFWYSPEVFREPPLENRSGLAVRFALERGERVLRVSAIAKGTPAAALLKEGLAPGAVLTQIDSLAVEDLDLWEVNRRLAGGEGNVVTLAWKSGKGLKLAPLKLRD